MPARTSAPPRLQPRAPPPNPWRSRPARPRLPAGAPSPKPRENRCGHSAPAGQRAPPLGECRAPVPSSLPLPHYPFRISARDPPIRSRRGLAQISVILSGGLITLRPGYRAPLLPGALSPHVHRLLTRPLCILRVRLPPPWVLALPSLTAASPPTPSLPSPSPSPGLGPGVPGTGQRAPRRLPTLPLPDRPPHGGWCSGASPGAAGAGGGWVAQLGRVRSRL